LRTKASFTPAKAWPGSPAATSPPTYTPVTSAKTPSAASKTLVPNCRVKSALPLGSYFRRNASPLASYFGPRCR
jgi:hypothetical protein